MAGVSKSIFNIISGEESPHPAPRQRTARSHRRWSSPHQPPLQYTLLEKSGKRTLGLNSAIGRYSGQDICTGAQGGQTPVLHHIPPHHQPSLAAGTPRGRERARRVSRQGASVLGLGRNHAPKVPYQQILRGLKKGHRGRRSEGGSRRLWVMLHR